VKLPTVLAAWNRESSNAADTATHSGKKQETSCILNFVNTAHKTRDRHDSAIRDCPFLFLLIRSLRSLCCDRSLGKGGRSHPPESSQDGVVVS